MKKTFILLLVLIMLALNPNYASAQYTPEQFRPKLTTIKHCEINQKNESFCIEYFADELELVVGDSLQKPLPRRVEEINAIRLAIGQNKAEDYGFYSDILDRTISFNSETRQKVEEAGFSNIIRIRFKNINNDEGLFGMIAAFAQDNNIKKIYLTSEVKLLGHTNDPNVDSQWYLEKEKFDQAHQLYGFGSPEIHTAFFDTGYDVTHEDLPKPFGYYNHITHKKEIPFDKYGHGTATAGVAMQIPNNNIGGVGTSPGVSLWVRKVMSDDGLGSWPVIVEGIVNQTSECIKLRQANENVRCTFGFSLAGLGPVPSVDAALDMAYKEGIVAVAAAGNATVSLDDVPFYPAAKPGTIAVAALTERDGLAIWSAYGTKSFVVAAVGINVLTTVPKGATYGDKSGYIAWNGTSFAAPQVLGAVNLAWSKNRYISSEQMKFVALGSADLLPNLRSLVASGGRLNAAMMLDIPINEIPSPPEIFELVNSSHISITTEQVFGPGVVGFLHYISNEPFDENTLNRKNVKQLVTYDASLQYDVGRVTETLIQNLAESSTWYIRIKSFNRVGNASELSGTLMVATKKSELFTKRTFTKEDGTPDPGQWYAVPGPVFYNDYELKIWHLSDILPSASGKNQFLWRFGSRNSLDYWVGRADVILMSEVFDLRGTNGASLMFDYFQDIGKPVVTLDEFQVYAVLIDERSNAELDWVLIKNYGAYPNSAKFATTEQVLDLSNFAGKKFKLGFRIFSKSHGLWGGIGWMFGNVRILIDQKEYLY